MSEMTPAEEQEMADRMLDRQIDELLDDQLRMRLMNERNINISEPQVTDAENILSRADGLRTEITEELNVLTKHYDRLSTKLETVQVAMNACHSVIAALDSLNETQDAARPTF